MKYGEGDGTPLHYSCLENPMDGGAWWAAVHGVAKSPTRRSDFIFTFHLHALEKEMATHSSVLAWRIPGTGEPPGCHLWGHIVGHDWSDLAAAAAWSIFLNETGIFFFFYKCMTVDNTMTNSTICLHCLNSWKGTSNFTHHWFSINSANGSNTAKKANRVLVLLGKQFSSHDPYRDL